MANFAQTLRYNWHLMRIIYLIIAIALLYQAWQTRDWAFGAVGALFLYQSVFNAGCCGAGQSKDTSIKSSAHTTLEDTDYTEIK
jgi:hypothetical protein